MMRIFVENFDEKSKTIDLFDENFHYLKNVMRVKIGDNLLIFNEEIEILSQIKSIDKKTISCEFIEVTREKESKSGIHLLSCVVKGDKMCDIVNIAVQCGVESITPVISKNCHIKDFNRNRANLTAKTAIIQSNGMIFPKISDPIKIEDAISLSKNGILMFGDLGQNKQISFENTEKKDIFCLIGPEGGFTDDEVLYLRSVENSVSVKLSKRILRAENATCAILAIANQLNGFKN